MLGYVNHLLTSQKCIFHLGSARIHRWRASGQRPEVAKGCSSESGIRVVEHESCPGRCFMKDLALRPRNGRAVPMGWSVVPTLVLAGDQ